MAVELSYHKGSVVDAAKELEIDFGRISKWRMDPRYNGGYIEGFYHAKRIHSAIDYRTPNEMEQLYMSKLNVAA